MDFIQRFIDFTKEYETPTSFWRWSSYALIAATLRDNVYYHHGLRKTYPNIYVVLLAESAEFRKSGSFGPVSQLLHELKITKILEGRASVQAIIEDLSQDSAINGTPLRGGSGIIISDELASYFVADPQLLPLITTMYDFKELYPYKLRSSKIYVKNLCITMLAASNSVYLRTVYTNAAVYGGLLGRTLMVKPDETRPPNDLLDIDITKYDLKPLTEELEAIKKLHGPVESTANAKKLYREWYRVLYHNYKKFPDAMGITQRIHTNVLKIAMILAAADNTLIIDLKHIEEAIAQVTSLKSNYEVYAMSSGKSTQAEIGAIFLNALWETKDKTLTRKEVLFKHWQDFTAEELDQLIITLEQAGLIQTIATGNNFAYQMTNKCIEVFTKGEKK